ncbi:MAG TPA: hypothetical protein VHV77_16565 [Pirellulales bacterium]|nr:hypothetical protein [Pirellulales bacterium]
MPRSKEPVNPFYVLLVTAGIVFSVTACAYAVMTFRSIRGEDLASSSSGLMQFMQQHGGMLLMVELLVLGVTTIAAMALDGFRSRRTSDAPPVEHRVDRDRQ